jgi:hypothetical protein
LAVRRRTGTTIDASTLHAIEADRQNISGLARHIRLAEQQDIQLQCNITATARQVAHNAEMERQRLESIESNEAIETARKDVSIGRLVYCSQRSLYKLILILFKMLSPCLGLRRFSATTEQHGLPVFCIMILKYKILAELY